MVHKQVKWVKSSSNLTHGSIYDTVKTVFIHVRSEFGGDDNLLLLLISSGSGTRSS